MHIFREFTLFQNYQNGKKSFYEVCYGWYLLAEISLVIWIRTMVLGAFPLCVNPFLISYQM